MQANEMMERVARALCRQYEIDDGFSPEQADRAAASEMYRNFLASAKVAIAAMREPTEAMIEASNREWDGRMSHRSSGAWQAMIDKALTP